jgi:hypothetical protein
LPSRYTVAFPAARNQLLKRVSRIIHQRNTNLDTAGKTFFIVSLILLGLFIKAALDTITLPIPEVYATSIKAPLPTSTNTQIEIDEPPHTRELVHALKRSSKSVRATSKTELTVTRSHKLDDIENQPIAPLTVDLSMILSSDTKEETTSHDHGERFQLPVEQDRQLIARSRGQLIVDRLQSDKEREQAMKDREQATKDRVQAEKDRRQAAEDRQRVQSERIHFMKERTQIMSRTTIDI